MTIQLAFPVVKIIVLLSIFALLNRSPATAQDSLANTKDTLLLEQLGGATQLYFYSPGREERAIEIAELVEKAVRFFHEQVGFTPLTKIYILSPQHWRGIAAPPLRDVYGFPHNLDQVQLAIAADDNEFWQSFLPPVDKLPAPLAEQIKIAYRRPDSSYSMMPFFDLLALHELGHSYTAQAGLKMHRNWMGELFVNIMLHTYVAEMKPELLPALEAFPNMVVGNGTDDFQYTSLNDFERLYSTMGMGPKNYGWYQCRFHSAAKEIYNKGGKDVLKKLWEALKKHQGKLSDEEFLSMLMEEVGPLVAGVYQNWE